MPRSRVPIKGSIGKSILTGKSSTTVQNITVVQQVTKQTSGGTGGVASTIWPLISQIPSNVLDLAALSTAGVTVFNGSDIITRALAVVSPLTIANATGAAGNPTISFATQGAHAVLAGPTPSFRSLTTADLPTIPVAQISGLATVATTGLLTDLSDVTISAVATNDVLEWNGSAWVNGAGGGGGSPLTTKGDLYGFDTANARVPVGADGDVLTADSGVALGVSWQPSAGGGTVTSVGLKDLSTTPIYAVSTTPVTSTGTLDITLLSQAANKVFAGPLSSTAQPTFRSLVSADIPTLPVSKISGLATVATTGLLSSLGDVTITSVATSDLLTWNGSKWVNQAGSGGGGGLTKIAEAVLGSAAATVTFSAIPGTYRTLVLRMTAQTSAVAPQLAVNFNGSTAAVYSSGLFFNGSGSGNPVTFGQTAMTFNSPMPANSFANQAAQLDMVMHDYAGTTFNKNVTGNWWRQDSAAAGYLGILSGSWAPTTPAAITSIVLSLASGNFNTGSVFTLYGEP